VSAVEFAVVAPALFLFVFGMVEFGRMVMIQQCVTNASRAGCRRAVLATTTEKSQVEDVVKDYLRTAIPNASGVSIAVNPQELNGVASGTQVRVAVTVGYKNLSWLPVGIFDPRVGAESVQQRE
jgi:Flp pilus assembly protein TadG